jgi:TRAP-type C4-dicarboxylate transport system permease small subunit
VLKPTHRPASAAFFAFLMVVCLALMVVMVFGNVVLRYGFNSGITVSEELSRWLFVWMTFLGAVVAVRNHAHLGTDTWSRACRCGQEDLPRRRPPADGGPVLC